MTWIKEPVEIKVDDVVVYYCTRLEDMWHSFVKAADDLMSELDRCVERLEAKWNAYSRAWSDLKYKIEDALHYGDFDKAYRYLKTLLQHSKTLSQDASFLGKGIPALQKGLYERSTLLEKTARKESVDREIIPKIRKVVETALKLNPALIKGFVEKGGKIYFMGCPSKRVAGEFFETPLTIYVYDVVEQDVDSLFNTLMHELKHFEQWLKKREEAFPKELAKLPWAKRPWEIEAVEFSKLMLDLAKTFGYLTLIIGGLFLLTGPHATRREEATFQLSPLSSRFK